jgi:hypothetical protein
MLAPREPAVHDRSCARRIDGVGPGRSFCAAPGRSRAHRGLGAPARSVDAGAQPWAEPWAEPWVEPWADDGRHGVDHSADDGHQRQRPRGSRDGVRARSCPAHWRGAGPITGARGAEPWPRHGWAQRTGHRQWTADARRPRDRAGDTARHPGARADPTAASDRAARADGASATDHGACPDAGAAGTPHDHAAEPDQRHRPWQVENQTGRSHLPRRAPHEWHAALDAGRMAALDRGDGTGDHRGAPARAGRVLRA